MSSLLAPCRLLLSLIILIANSTAPLSYREGRMVLVAHGQAVPPRPVAKVRVVSHVLNHQGYRASVGLSNCRPDVSLDHNVTPLTFSHPSSLHVAFPRLEQRASRPTPPLRC